MKALRYGETVSNPDHGLHRLPISIRTKKRSSVHSSRCWVSLRSLVDTLAGSKAYESLDRDRRPGVIPDLTDIKRSRMAVQTGVAVQCCAVEHASQFAFSRDHAIAKGGGQGLEAFAVVPVHGEIDAKTLLGVVDEFLAEDSADVERRDALAVTDDRGDCEDAERIAPLLDGPSG